MLYGIILKEINSQTTSLVFYLTEHRQWFFLHGTWIARHSVIHSPEETWGQILVSLQMVSGFNEIFQGAFKAIEYWYL